MEVLRRMIWRVADFSGVEVLTYAILHNHFHILISIPQWVDIDDDELLRRFCVLRPRSTPFIQRFIRPALMEGNPLGLSWRKRQIGRMGDISKFMKQLKQEFTIWFNKKFQRRGTLWESRFNSILVEPENRVLEAIAAYIDLNPVRAGLVQDPKDYLYCGYAEAVSGNEKARKGIQAVVGGGKWSDAQADYRILLFSTGSKPNAKNQPLISQADYERVVREGGRLPLFGVLRCRVRYFSLGAILGGVAFVKTHGNRYISTWKKTSCVTYHRLPLETDWGELVSLNRVRTG